jgi:glycine/D-amino acid oxidase-like deaminating enzyme
MSEDVQQTSAWTATAKIPAYPVLSENLDVDVIVIGGGVAGVTAAYLLKQHGQRVALVEQQRCAAGQSGRSTAHLTAVTDMPLSRLVERHGADRARAVWDAGFSAIGRIRAAVRDERINCGFSWVRGCLHAGADVDRSSARAELSHEASVANALGFDAVYVDMVPGICRPGVRFDGQARLHPLRYLSVLLDRIPGAGSHVFEQTPVHDIDRRRLHVQAGDFRIAAQYIVVATHLPLLCAAGQSLRPLWPFVLDVSTSYVVSGTAQRGALEEGIFWEHGDSAYDYLRVDRHDQHDRVTLGGCDHPGTEALTAADRFSRLGRRLSKYVTDLDIGHQWSGQVVGSRDGLPYIGELSDGLFTATGFGGNGMTFGTLAGMMACDGARGHRSRWRDLFDPRRTNVLLGPWNAVRPDREAS